MIHRLRVVSILSLALSASIVNAAQICPPIGPIATPAGAVSATIFNSVSSTVDPNVPLFVAPYAVQNCVVDVAIVTGPLSDRSTINIRLRLPQVWNGKLFMGGGGGFSGNYMDETGLGFPIYLNSTPLNRGYATVVTDTGHQASGTDGSWALNAPEKQINYAYKGVHLAAVTAKTVLVNYYGQTPSHSYFQGCSNGGREALMEASRYPTDFDGIIAGAPVVEWTNVLTRLAHDVRSNYLLSVAEQLDEFHLDLITQTVLAKCDAKDGVIDGIINNPKVCNFHPKTDLPRCPGNTPAAGCFTSKQIQFISSIYQDFRVSSGHDGQIVIRGHEPGSETGNDNPLAQAFDQGWSSWVTGTPIIGPPIDGRYIGASFLFEYGLDAFFIFNNPSFDLVSYLLSNNDNVVYKEMVSGVGFLDLPTFNLANFKANGGKLVMYQGWIDPALMPRSTIDDYRAIKQQTRGSDSDFLRLYMVPGLAHCAYGPGPQIFAGVDVLEQWVENGNAPNSITAFSIDFSKNRPLCPYPQVAKLIDPTNANNVAGWTCKTADGDDGDVDDATYNSDEDARVSANFGN